MDGSLQSTTKHCAIYCRKSSEEGLEQEFNSLDAQREACAAYVKSQQFEGWQLVSKHYDDGGKSGGSLERPALKALMEDIKLGQIQVIIVYKVDRLTRSLADFAKLVDLFDTYGVSFVSVTQQFNTTSSMGRLTLNVLLSFAQYEREVTGERIRDKIAASKEKGMWMGGAPPLGYDPDGRTLKINEAEANKVRTIFKLYLKLGCVRLLQTALEEQGIHSKAWVSKKGRSIGGAVFTRGALYKILNNPIYQGHIKHKDKLYEGQHEAIIEEPLWNKVQARLKQGTVSNKSKTKSDSLLAGLLKDERGNGFTPTYASKKGRRYRYYVNQAILQHRKDEAGSIHRLSAPKIEELVEHWLLQKLENKAELTAMLLEYDPASTTHAITQHLDKASELRGAWQGKSSSDKRGLLNKLVQHITLTANQMVINYEPVALLSVIGVEMKISHQPAPPQADTIAVQLKRAAQEAKLVIPASTAPTKDQTLIKALVRAHCWLDKVKMGETGSLTEVAKQEGLQRRYIEKHISLALLSAKLQKAILEGTQPKGMKLETIKG